VEPNSNELAPVHGALSPSDNQIEAVAPSVAKQGRHSGTPTTDASEESKLPIRELNPHMLVFVITSIFDAIVQTILPMDNVSWRIITLDNFCDHLVRCLSKVVIFGASVP